MIESQQVVAFGTMEFLHLGMQLITGNVIINIRPCQLNTSEAI